VTNKKDARKITADAFKAACHNFLEVAAPYLIIKDEQHYEEALELTEYFLEQSEDSLDDPLNHIIGMLARAIEVYEDFLEDEELIKTIKERENQKSIEVDIDDL